MSAMFPRSPTFCPQEHRSCRTFLDVMVRTTTTAPQSQAFCCPQKRTFYYSHWIHWSWDLAAAPSAQSPEPCVCRYGYIHHGFRLDHLFCQMAGSTGDIGDKGCERTSAHHLSLTCRNPAPLHLCCLLLKAEPIPPSSQSCSHSLRSRRHWPTVLSENF